MATDPVSAPFMRRHAANPVLAPKDVPYPTALVFNAGVCKFQGRYVMVFRNDVAAADDPRRLVGTNIGFAESPDGVKWTVRPTPWLDIRDAEISRVYDPRLTVIDGRVVMCFAMDTRHGLRGGVGVTDDFEKFEILSLSAPDNRNMVLFPEKINGRYARLERPMPVYSRGRDRFDTWYGDSPDLRDWGGPKLVAGVEDFALANNKIGPGAPPIKTPKGWLAAFHAVDYDESRGKHGWEEAWKKRYWIELALLDLHEPWKMVGRGKGPLMVPEAPYEIAGGFRDYVLFPGGMVLEDDGEVKMYYGAGDAVECLATAHVDEMLSWIEPYTR